MLKRTVGVFLTAMAAAVAVHTVVEPLYHVSRDGQPYSPVWSILNPLMGLAIVLGLILGWRRKQEADGQGGETGVTREYLAANTQLYGLLCVGILFFWNWFNLLMPDWSAPGDDTVALVWILIDATLPLLLGAMGIHLLRAREPRGSS